SVISALMSSALAKSSASITCCSSASALAIRQLISFTRSAACAISPCIVSAAGAVDAGAPSCSVCASAAEPTSSASAASPCATSTDAVGTSSSSTVLVLGGGCCSSCLAGASAAASAGTSPDVSALGTSSSA